MFVPRTYYIQYEEKVQGRWGRVATRCAAIAEHVEVSRREEDIIMHKDYNCRQALMIITREGEGAKAAVHSARSRRSVQWQWQQQ